MTIIKLDAIDSTNDYLKQLSREQELENLTIVMANEQTNGKGQLGAKWHSEPGKNLLMSILVKDFPQKKNSVFDLNVIVALSVSKLLNMMKIPKVYIKWPNDIMAGGEKIAGILIENTIKPDGSVTAVIGIGMNVNQTTFEGVPNATYLAKHTKIEFEDLEDLAKLIRSSLENYLLAATKQMDTLWDIYNENLFRINIPTHFEDIYGRKFMGVIKYVTREGNLVLLRNDAEVYSYEVKEIKLII